MKKIYLLLLISILTSFALQAQDSVTVTFRLQNFYPNGSPVMQTEDSSSVYLIYGNFETLNATKTNGYPLISSLVDVSTNTSPNVLNSTSTPYLYEIQVRFPNSAIGQELLFTFNSNGAYEDSTLYLNNPTYIECVHSIMEMMPFDPLYGLFYPEQNMLRSLFIPSNDITLQYCFSACLQCDGSQPQVNSGSIYFSGKTFVDANQDGMLNPGEVAVPGTHVTIISATDTISSITSNYGNYGFFGNPGTYTIQCTAPVNYTSTFTDQTITIDSAGGVNSLNIPLQLSTDYFELQPYFNPGLMVAGFSQTSSILINNSGNAVNAVSCNVTLPTNVNFVSSTPTPSAVNGTTYTFLFANVAALSNAYISINTSLPPPPTFMPGDVLTWDIDVSSVPNEANMENNSDSYIIPVFSSYDPNDKIMLKGNQLTPVQVNNGELFQYRIRFQNTGNFPASFIHVLDTLVAGLNPTTLKVISSSHECNLSINNDRELDFYFPNIQLPDSTSDPEGSQGYVIFEVQPFLPVEEGDEIENTAHIYFDFNPAVITNTDRVRIETPEGLLIWNTTATNTPWFDVNGTIRWSQSHWKNLAVYSIDGRLIQSEILQGNSSSFQLKNAGVYVLQFSNASDTSYFKVMR